MKRRLILSNQQLISMLDVLGYEPLLHEEVQYQCGLDHSCVPVIVSTLTIRLDDWRVNNPCNPNPLNPLKSA